VLDKGKMIYQGPAIKVQDYLKKLKLNIPIQSNISDFFMMEISEYKKILENNSNYTSVFNNKKYKSLIGPEIKNELKELKKTV
jgi:hypothetical protein